MALTEARKTSSRSGDVRRLPVKADTLILQGAMVALDGGYACPVRAATGLVGLGCALATVDNRNGADGALAIDVEAGVFRYANKADDALTIADIGDDAYGVDDETVAKTSATNTRSAIGKVFDVDADGVWVRF